MFQVQCAMFHVSRTMWHLSCIMYLVSCVTYHVQCMISGHALYEKGLQGQQGIVPLFGSQKQSALLVSVINR